MKASLLLSFMFIFGLSSVAFGGGSNRPDPETNSVLFERGFNPQHKKTVTAIANAIKSGRVERLRKYVRSEDDSKRILAFWSGVDGLQKLKFKARQFDNKIIFSDASRGMSSCDITHVNGRYVVDDCMFNDGN